MTVAKTRRRRIRLIPNWRKAWRFYSTQAAAILAALSALQEWLPQAQQHLPPQTFARITLALSALIVVLRVVKQFNADDGEAGK